MPIILQSFNMDIVDYLLANSTFRIIELHNKLTKITEDLLRRKRVRKIYGIGITWENLVSKDHERQRTGAKPGFALPVVHTLQKDPQLSG